MDKTIKVKEDTYKQLNQQRIAGKTFDDVIRDLLLLWLSKPKDVIEAGGGIL